MSDLDVIGLPDGSVGLSFPFHPAHISHDRIQVTFSRGVIKLLKTASKNAVRLQDMVVIESPEEEAEE